MNTHWCPTRRTCRWSRPRTCRRGFTEAQRGQPGGFIGDPDVMDTWATSSLSPQIVGGWERDPDLFARVFPMDLRPQAHEIIRTWLFATVVRSRAEHGTLPWHTADDLRLDRGEGEREDFEVKGKLCHRSERAARQVRRGRRALLVRLRPAGRGPGARRGSDEGWSAPGDQAAQRFAVRARLRPATSPSLQDVTEPLDRAMLARLSTVVDSATAAFVDYDHTGALVATEAFFWEFCDDYIELVKERAYGLGPTSSGRGVERRGRRRLRGPAGGASARSTVLGRVPVGTSCVAWHSCGCSRRSCRT